MPVPVLSDLQIPNGAGLGKVYTSDAAGLAAWSAGSGGGTPPHVDLIGDGAAYTFDVDHNFDSRNVLVVVRETDSPYERVFVKTTTPTANRVTLDFTGDPSPPTNDQYTVVVTKGEGAAGTSLVAPNVQTGSYTLVLADQGKAVEMNSASATVVTVPPNSSVAFPVGTVLEVGRFGTGTVTIAAGAGVTIRSRAGLLAIGAQYSSVSLRKRATDEWSLVGDLA